MNAVTFELVGETVLSVRLAASRMVKDWHHDGRIPREFYRHADEIGAKCAEDLGDAGEDNDMWNSKIAAWLREYVNAE